MAFRLFQNCAVIPTNCFYTFLPPANKPFSSQACISYSSLLWGNTWQTQLEGGRVCLAHSLRGTVLYQEGMATVAWGSWSHVSMVQRQRVAGSGLSLKTTRHPTPSSRLHPKGSATFQTVYQLEADWVFKHTSPWVTYWNHNTYPPIHSGSEAHTFLSSWNCPYFKAESEQSWLSWCFWGLYMLSIPEYLGWGQLDYGRWILKCVLGFGS